MRTASGPVLLFFTKLRWGLSILTPGMVQFQQLFHRGWKGLSHSVAFS